MASKNLISIIIPVYNGERFIGKAIESCLHQSEKQGWEAIVVNDGSTDNSQQVVENYLDDPRIKLIVHEKNKGLPSARNTGIRNSSGNYVSFLDADDCYLPHTIKNVLTAGDIAKNRQSVAMFYCNYLRINERGETTALVRVKPPMKRPELHLQFLLPKLLLMIPSTTFVRRDALERVGMFDERFLRCEDIQLFARIVERYDYSKTELFQYRQKGT
ncbi:MAG: glycosyltransferase [Chlorobiales bacterium]|nr:glycosyltransferase [Chlorobiales bacterium]